MNVKCKVCLELELDQRTDVDDRLMEGESFSLILKDYPMLSRQSLSRHLKHMGNLTNESAIAAQRLVREQARARMADFSCESFVVALRHRLITVIEDSEIFNRRILFGSSGRY